MNPHVVYCRACNMRFVATAETHAQMWAAKHLLDEHVNKGEMLPLLRAAYIVTAEIIGGTETIKDPIPTGGGNGGSHRTEQKP